MAIPPLGCRDGPGGFGFNNLIITPGGFAFQFSPTKGTLPVECFGKEASEFTCNLVLDKEVTVEMDPVNTAIAHRDKYGRLLAYIYLPDGSMLNEKIIKEGYGHAYTKYPFDAEKMELFRSAENEARENQHGLWSPNIICPKVKNEIEKKPGNEPTDDESQTRENPDDKIIVYITDTGAKYHRKNCRYLKYSKHAISLREAKESGYEPCKVCKPPK